MALLADLNVVWHLIFRPRSGQVHADWLNRFYKAQAGDYDSFRRRFLKGREQLWSELLSVSPAPQDGVWIDMGGGTGSNMTGFGDRLSSMKKIYILDLAKPLLDIADRRIKDSGWKNVETVEADATTWIPPEGKADVITFSYSLTMIPDWFKAIDHALKILNPGGLIGVVDFHIARKFPDDRQKRQSFATRSFWPAWFSCDNVFLSPDHYPYLDYRFETELFTGKKLTVPYFPAFWWKVPYYIYVGKKPLTEPEGCR
jgi:S-adenosylmethionine-diacylgycerolhomoserine-N-methlytransferase